VLPPRTADVDAAGVAGVTGSPPLPPAGACHAAPSAVTPVARDRLPVAPLPPGR